MQHVVRTGLEALTTALSKIGEIMQKAAAEATKDAGTATPNDGATVHDAEVTKEDKPKDS